MASDFRRRVVEGVGWTALQSAVLRLSSVLTFVVLGRLLDPRNIGLAALGLALTGLVTVLVDLGVSTYLVRAEELSPSLASTAFWLTTAQAVFGMLLMLATSGAVASALGLPELRPVLFVLALNVMIFGLAAVPTALLVRDLQFRPLAVREMISGVVGAVVGVGSALAGAGVWALVAQNTTQGLVALVLLWRVQAWRPRRELDLAEARSLIAFGLPLAGTGLVQAVRDRLEQLLLGVLAGPAALGYWAIATRLLTVATSVTVSILDQVALPVFARARRTVAGIRAGFATATSLSALALGLVLALLAATSPELLPLLFGDRWTASVQPAQVLCAAYAVGTLGYFTRPALLADGRSGTDFGLAAAGLAIHVGVVLLVAPHGLTTLATALVAETLVTTGIGALVLRARLRIDLGAYLTAIRLLVAATVSAGVGLLVLQSNVGSGASGSWLRLGAITLVVAISYAGLARFLEGDVIHQVRADLLDMRRRRSPDEM